MDGQKNENIENIVAWAKKRMRISFTSRNIAKHTKTRTTHTIIERQYTISAWAIYHEEISKYICNVW
jgi:hypothetical protein